MKQFSQWKDEEVKRLFEFIENGKSHGKSLSQLFNDYAKDNNRKPNSVRNYYYAELLYIEKNPEKAQRLNINLSLHQKCEQKAFDETETLFVVEEILRLKSLGFSVRKACLKLSNGNLSEMVRLQNKYRTILIKEPEMILKCKEKLRQKGFLIEEKVQQKSNVIRMPERSHKLSDSEINSLFLGLVKLVKKQALEEIGSNLRKESEFANDTLRKTLVDLQTKDMEIKKLRTQFKVLCAEKEKLRKEVISLRGKNASLLKSGLKDSEKLEKLRKFSKNKAKNVGTQLKLF